MATRNRMNVRGQQKQEGSWNAGEKQKLFQLFRSGEAAYRGGKFTADEVHRVQNLDPIWQKFAHRNFKRNYQNAAAEFLKHNPHMHDDNMTSVAFNEGSGLSDDYIPESREDDSTFFAPESRVRFEDNDSPAFNGQDDVEDIRGMLSRTSIGRPSQEYQRRMTTLCEDEIPFQVPEDSLLNVSEQLIFTKTMVEDDGETTFKLCNVQVGPFHSGHFDGEAPVRIINGRYLEIKVVRLAIADSPAEVVDGLQANGGKVPKNSATYAAIADEMSALRRTFGSGRIFTVFYVLLPFVVDEAPYNDGDHFPGRRLISIGHNGVNGTILNLQYRSPEAQSDRVQQQYTVSNNDTMHANVVYQDPPPVECHKCGRKLNLRSLGDGTACCELCDPNRRGWLRG